MNIKDSTRLHRIQSVRKQQGLSLRSAARRMGLKVDQVLEQENERADLRLSVLYAWQRALDVPLSELLIEQADEFRTPVLVRARMIRVIKTVAAIRREPSIEGVQHLADRLYTDLIEMMPELKDVAPWPPLESCRRSRSNRRKEYL
jgi:transcriptional regulator with XRE-family HTH domain